MRNQYLLLTLILVIAFALRAWQPGRMSVEHFDEGVYASNFYSGHLEFRYPDRHLYAPPLLPAIYEWTLIITGSPHAVMWVNVVLGTGLVAAVWWLTRLIVGVSVLGEAAALAAAIILAFDNFFIQYSRAALTDIPVCLFMVLAVGMGLHAIRSHIIYVLPAAIFTALAWWTKYNGWLPLAIIGAGVGGWIVFDRASKKLAMQGVSRWCLIALGAFLMWVPCLYGLKEFGGYEAVAKNHAGYVVGFSGWWNGLMSHFAIQLHYSKSGILGLAAAVVILQMLYWPLSKVQRGAWWLAPTLLMGTFFICDFSVLFVLAAIGFWSTRPELQHGGTKKEDTPQATLGWWMLLAWTLGLLLTTPLYSPYPRLLAPLKISLIVASAIGVVMLLQTLIEKLPATFEQGQPVPKRFQMGVVFIVFALAQIAMTSNNPSFQDRSGLRSIAESIVNDIQNDSQSAQKLVDLDAIIYTIAEPGLYYHLASLEDGPLDFVTQPASNLGMLQPGKTDARVPTYLLFTFNARLERELSPEFNQLELVKSYDYQPSDLVLLDDSLPSALDQNRLLVVQLWKVRQ